MNLKTYIGICSRFISSPTPTNPNRMIKSKNKATLSISFKPFIPFLSLKNALKILNWLYSGLLLSFIFLEILKAFVEKIQVIFFFKFTRVPFSSYFYVLLFWLIKDERLKSTKKKWKIESDVYVDNKGSVWREKTIADNGGGQPINDDPNDTVRYYYFNIFELDFTF